MGLKFKTWLSLNQSTKSWSILQTDNPTKVLKCLISVLHNFGLRKVSPAKQLLIQQVGFVNPRHFFQPQSRAKH